MDYEAMLDLHKQNQASVTIAAMPVPIEEASRFGIVVTDDNGQITEFEEKPENPKSNLASMGIYIFSWPVLREALITMKDQNGCDFGKHIIPYCHENGERIFAYEFNGYWKDVGTLGSYWEANMELIDLIPEFNLYEEFWKIYTKQNQIEPQYIASTASVKKSITGAGNEIYGKVENSVLGAGVVVEEGASVIDSIIMKNTVIKKGARIEKAIIAEDCVIGENTKVGVGESAESKLSAKIYAFDLAVVGENSTIPANVEIGKNTAIRGETTEEDFPQGKLESGGYIIKEGEES
jgi:glucose-1-phosphate adenylyltransferase